MLVLSSSYLSLKSHQKINFSKSCLRYYASHCKIKAAFDENLMFQYVVGSILFDLFGKLFHWGHEIIFNVLVGIDFYYLVRHCIFGKAFGLRNHMFFSYFNQ